MKKNLTVWNLFSVVILAAFALFIMYPIFLILYRSVIHGDTGALTLQNFAHFFAKKFYWGTMVNSLKVTVISTILSAALGLPLAYLMRSVKIKGSRLNIALRRPNSSIPFICERALRITRELSEPNFRASVGNSTPDSLLRNSGNTFIHRSTKEWENATIR